ncbi:unnamed protein product [Coffea canephora]|uniref:Legume lectin domain-containing protein n=1 Tax=Coffea canephora TaxID=49390 RepID=A0A068TPS1_COFCA|nr:unnamed protein product [Coffea canephora]
MLQEMLISQTKASKSLHDVLGNKSGRAAYVKPPHLWDKASGILTDFITYFTFTIDSEGSSSYADGLAFFLAPVNSSCMNINSMKSVNTTIWWNNITLGAVNDAWISQNATSRNLAVTFTGLYDNKITQDSPNYVVDLRVYLPELATFGFSAATGALFEKNNPTPSASQIPNTVVTRKKKSKAALVIGLSVRSPVLILGLTLFSCVGWKKSKKKQDHSHDLFMDNEFEKGSRPKKFTYNELARATNNFDEGEKPGEGRFTEVSWEMKIRMKQSKKSPEDLNKG